MEKFKLRLFPIAKQDLQDIVNALNKQSSVEAFKLYDEIIESIGLLSQLPLHCPYLLDYL